MTKKEADQFCVLIVDDRPENRRLLEALLAPRGYKTLLAENGPEAMVVAGRDRPDLILLDVRMPGMDGYAVTRALRLQVETRTIPIILVTAMDDHQSRILGMDAGANDFLTKPIDRAQLWSRVHNLIVTKTANP